MIYISLKFNWISKQILIAERYSWIDNANPFKHFSNISLQSSSSMYRFRAGCKHTRLYMYMSNHFYLRNLHPKVIYSISIRKSTYMLSIKEIRNLNHKDRPCYEGDDYDNYILKVCKSHRNVHFSFLWKKSTKRYFGILKIYEDYIYKTLLFFSKSHSNLFALL